ncbi:MAG: hypothetical protein OEZ10_13870 [Gammaproteobacteria bacterium]|nr:hypothetical protein [Gammaproteobacteria bacterium]
MSDTLVIQSHRSPLPYSWLEQCIVSVRRWAESGHHEYRFVGDELFEVLPDDIRQLASSRPVMASDLARLLLLRDGLASGYQTVIWLDADFLIFDPSRFVLPDDSFAVGREVWVDHDHSGKLKAWTKVHNALLMFCRDNSFLDFYIDTAKRFLGHGTSKVPPQFIGPKLLTALHNVAGFPVMEIAGMLSPMVARDILAGGGVALDLFRKKSPVPIAGANLCCSSCDSGELTDTESSELVDCLVSNPGKWF